MSNKRKQFRISTVLFVEMFGKGIPRMYDVTRDPLPADSKIVNVRFDWPTQVVLLIESESFPGLEGGDIIPDITPVLEVKTEWADQDMLKRAFIAGTNAQELVTPAMAGAEANDLRADYFRRFLHGQGITPKAT